MVGKQLEKNKTKNETVKRLKGLQTPATQGVNEASPSHKEVSLPTAPNSLLHSIITVGVLHQRARHCWVNILHVTEERLQHRGAKGYIFQVPAKAIQWMALFAPCSPLGFAFGNNDLQVWIL